MKLHQIKKTVFRSSMLVLLFLVALFIFNLKISNAQSTLIVSKEVEGAVLAEDWAKVAKLLDDVKAETPEPVLRLIKGHADLALNRNNESLCMFISVASSDNDLQEWDKWTRDFAGRNPKSIIAYYFRGDALARIKKWDEALTAFNKALELNPKHAMVLNARGVVYAAKRDLTLARNDFDNAISINQSFADAYANLGSRFIQMKDGAEGAINEFDKALRISPGFALALHGKGNVEVILFQIEEAEKNLNKAKEYGTCGKELFNENIINIAAYVHGVDKKELIAMIPKDGDGIGMSLKRTFENPVGSSGLKQFENSLKNFERFGGKPGVGQWSFNRVGESFYHLSPTEKITANKMVDNFLDKNPNLSRHFYEGAKDFAHNPIRSFGYEVKGKIGGTMGGMEAGVKIPASTSDQAYRDIGKGFQDKAMNRMSNLPEGVLASLADANWDEGQWPFVEYYGLIYSMK